MVWGCFVATDGKMNSRVYQDNLQEKPTTVCRTSEARKRTVYATRQEPIEYKKFNNRMASREENTPFQAAQSPNLNSIAVG